MLETRGRALMEILKEYWAQLASGVALVVWAIRVESQTKANTTDIKRLWTQRTEDQAAHSEARKATNEMLAEMRADIKELLRQVRG